MDLTFTVHGRRCDLALHPISSKTVERIAKLGRLFYTQKYIHWWRNGNTSTCGMKIDDECAVKVKLGDSPVEFNPQAMNDEAVFIRRRHYLESKARHLALLGYNDEYCHMIWRWKNVEAFDPAKFQFFVHRWDTIMREKDFLILDDIRYDGAFADEQDWGDSCGFTLVDPRVIDLDELRRELAGEKAQPMPAPAPQPQPVAVAASVAVGCGSGQAQAAAV